MNRNFTTSFILPLACFASIAISGFFVGCQPSDAPAMGVQEKESARAAPPTQEKGMLDKATDLMKQAKDSGGETAMGASKWVQDKLGGAAQAGGQTAEDTLKWANDAFKSLKDQGLTTASDTGEWLTQDWRNMESWQYKVKTYQGGLEDEMLEAKMNEMGTKGWECFNIQGNSYYYKKPTHSYLRQLPFRDLLRLIPLMEKN